jgi:hypothetical protein
MCSPCSFVTYSEKVLHIRHELSFLTGFLIFRQELLVSYFIVLTVTNHNESTHSKFTMFYITVKKKLTKTIHILRALAPWSVIVTHYLIPVTEVRICKGGNDMWWCHHRRRPNATIHSSLGLFAKFTKNSLLNCTVYVTSCLNADCKDGRLMFVYVWIVSSVVAWMWLWTEGHITSKWFKAMLWSLL